MDGVVGDEHSDEKDEKEEDACSPGEEGPSPGVEADPAATIAAIPPLPLLHGW